MQDGKVKGYKGDYIDYMEQGNPLFSFFLWGTGIYVYANLMHVFKWMAEAGTR